MRSPSNFTSYACEVIHALCCKYENKRSSEAICSILRAIVCALETQKPLWPCLRISSCPMPCTAITGRPWAIASDKTRPCVSDEEGNKKISVLR